jgi:ankyrin repeat protein
MRGLLAFFVLAFAATTAAAGDPLFNAIAAGNKTAVEQALARGADVNSRAPDQATPLINAALGNELAIAELLLSKGADIMARSRFFRKPSDRQAVARKGGGARRLGQQIWRHAVDSGG